MFFLLILPGIVNFNLKNKYLTFVIKLFYTKNFKIPEQLNIKSLGCLLIVLINYVNIFLFVKVFTYA